MLELKKLYFTVPVSEGNTDGRRNIIDGIDFTFEDGKFYAITGPNGSGKTSLAKLIMGINPVSQGAILYNGEDISTLTITERAKKGIAYSFQQPARFKGITFRDLLMIATGVEDESKLLDILGRVGICPLSFLDKEVDAKLSGGEIKKIELATTIAVNPGLAIYDEPDTGIDLWTIGPMVNLLKRELREHRTTTVVVSHNRAFLEAADVVMIIHSGKIVYQGALEGALPLLDDLSICTYGKAVKESAMLDALDKNLLRTVADLEGLPKGAYNIRKNGKLLSRQVSANIDIESNAEGTGIIVTIKPGTQNESVHIPVILSQAGLYDVVYNSFIIGDDADVTIVAGCGIHCGSSEPEGHAGIHEFRVGKRAKVTYVEKHFASGDGRGKRSLNPTTKVFLDEGAKAEMELTQIAGVDEANRINEAELGPDSLLLITERVLTDGEQTAVSTNNIVLKGAGCRANMISRSVMKGNSKQTFYATMDAQNRCYGHIECDAIIMDNGANETMPALKAGHPDAELTHEASIGKIANDQLTKLMSLGLTYDQAVNRIIQGFLEIARCIECLASSRSERENKTSHETDLSMRRLFQRYTYWLLFAASLTGSWGCANLTSTLPSPPGFLTPINFNGPYDADIPLRDARRIKNASLMQDQAVPYLFLRVADHFQTADDAPRSLHFFNRALQEFRKRGNAPGEGMALNRKLSALVHFGRLEEVFQELEERGRMHSADPLRAFINYGCGYYHLKAGHYAEAQKLFAQVIAAAPLETDNGEWLALQRDAALGIGLVVVLGEYFPFLADQLSTLDFNYDLFQTIRQSMAAAAAHLEEVVALNRRIRATDVYRYYPEVVSPFADCDTANLLGLAYGAAGKTAQAVKQLDQAARLAKQMNYPLGKADHRFIFDQIYLINEKRIPDIRDVQALSDLAERYQWVSYSIWAKLMKAHEYRQAGDINQTIEIVDRALALLEDNVPWLSREEGFRGILLFRRRALYETLIGLHALRNNQEGAFQTAERMKGAFLAEHAAEELTARTDELREPLMQMREQRRQLAANYRRLITPAKELDVMAAVEKSRTARKACGDLIAEIRIKDEALHTLIDPARPRTKEVQRLLDANTTLFAYYAGEKSLFIWVISKNAVRQEIVKVSRSEADHLVTSWIDAMKRRDRDVADRLAEKVYDLFLKPVIPFVYGDRIGFVPDISLYHMPFAAMRYVESYLADGFSLFQIPCVSLLQSLLADASPLDAKKAIFVEDAACQEKRQAAKPAALETNVLKRVLPYSPTVVLNGRAGNRMADISGNYGIISAVLAEAFSAQPSSSPGRTPASLPCFRAGDIVRLKISGQLTLLSVCHPRRSWTVEKGITASLVEWLYGVSPRIIIQLWDVDEKARKVFWPLFYDALKKRGSVADALRDAQGGMIQNGYGPFDWAAFVLTGRY